MVVTCMKTTDGRYAVYVHPGHSAELIAIEGVRRTTILGPAPLFRVTDRLVELGYEVTDLILETT
jgi:hypothetical protein